MSTEKKKEQQLLEDVAAQPAAQSSYSTAGLNSRKEVENALTNAVYTPGQSVTDAAADLRNWQQNGRASMRAPIRPHRRPHRPAAGAEQLPVQLCTGPALPPVSPGSTPRRPQRQRGRRRTGCGPHRRLRLQLCGQCGPAGVPAADGRAERRLPSLYRLALDTYNSEGDDVVTRIDQLNTQEKNAQAQYNAELSDYYSQLDRKGSAYNAAYEQDYGRYQDYLAGWTPCTATIPIRSSRPSPSASRRSMVC